MYYTNTTFTKKQTKTQRKAAYALQCKTNKATNKAQLAVLTAQITNNKTKKLTLKQQSAVHVLNKIYKLNKYYTNCFVQCV